MTDEVERSLLRTCRGWEKAHDALWVRVQALTIERDEARQNFADEHDISQELGRELLRLQDENETYAIEVENLRHIVFADAIPGSWLADLGDEIERLKAENLRLFALVPEQTYDALKAENERLKGEVMVAARVRPRREENEALRALVSWIHGMLLDEADPTEIRAAIDRYWKKAKHGNASH